MAKQVYRTAQGKNIDMRALQLKNEKVKAVGNMGVNARGDLVDSSNKTVTGRNQKVSSQYRKTTNVSDTPVQDQKPTQSLQADEQVVQTNNSDIFNDDL